MNLTQDFKQYAKDNFGVGEYEFNTWENIQQMIYNPTVLSGFQGQKASLTPMILEEREMRVTQMSVFDRLMMDRIIWLAGPVNDRMSTVVQAQLMFLDNLDVKDITLHIDTPGGSTKSGKSIIDVMNYISSDIITVNTGMAASMGSLLLSSGTKGKRYSLPSSKVMIHQVSAGVQGNVQDMRISLEEAEKENISLFEILAKNTGKDYEQVLLDSVRDKWFDAQQALDYGLIDGIITKKIKK